MKLKLGSSVRDPLSGAHGFVTQFTSGYAICKADDGTKFRVNPLLLKHRGRPPAAARVLVRVVDNGEVISGWLAAEQRGSDWFHVIDGDRLWHGADLHKEQVEVGAGNSEEAA